MTGDRGPEIGDREAVQRPTRAFFLGAIALCVLPIFAHGCHRGDHDDEPTVVPVAEQRADPSSGR
ncbi:unnamed protein product [Gemmataceae bacterium]|jgi:hypothetical protein|nr:unnamed protein product [Gemmataceae bacterium]VTT96450.1 unnamed protein product [Gemmataceae bacterium]